MVVATRYAAQNQFRNGVRVLCITVPAVTDVCWPQAAHSHRCRRSSTQAALPPHRGQTNPSGQREAARYRRHAASVANRSWNSMIVRGKSGRGTGAP
jgi:hypothetical protein